jgi:hypothetical protein
LYSTSLLNCFEKHEPQAKSSSNTSLPPFRKASEEKFYAGIAGDTFSASSRFLKLFIRKWLSYYLLMLSGKTVAFWDALRFAL